MAEKEGPPVSPPGKEKVPGVAPRLSGEGPMRMEVPSKPVAEPGARIPGSPIEPEGRPPGAPFAAGGPETPLGPATVKPGLAPLKPLVSPPRITEGPLPPGRPPVPGIPRPGKTQGREVKESGVPGIIALVLLAIAVAVLAMPALDKPVPGPLKALVNPFRKTVEKAKATPVAAKKPKAAPATEVPKTGVPPSAVKPEEPARPAEAKPPEVKPAEAKPAEEKTPAEVKPEAEAKPPEKEPVGPPPPPVPPVPPPPTRPGATEKKL